MSTDHPPVVLYWDGLCEPNPGGWMAWAWVALARDGSVVAQGGKASPPQTGNTNNWAEYQGLIAGLRWLKAHDHEGVRVRGDSQLVTNQVSGRWNVGSPTLRELYLEAASLLVYTTAEIEWVPREKNARADALCVDLLPAEARPVVAAAIARRQQLRRR